MAHALPKHISIIYTYEVSTDTTYSSSDTWRLISMQKWSDLGPWCYCHAHSLTYIQKLTLWTRISTTCIDLSALKIWFVVQVLYMYHPSKNWIYWKCVGGGMRRRGHNFERPDMLKDPTRDSTATWQSWLPTNYLVPTPVAKIQTSLAKLLLTLILYGPPSPRG